MDEAELNELRMLSSYQGSFKSKRLKKTIKDKCLVIGETTMYYGNFGSVQVLSPIPGSPSPDGEAGSVHIRPDSPEEAVLSPQTEQHVTSKKGKMASSKRKKSTAGDKKKTSQKYGLPPLKAAPASNSRRPPQMSRGREPCSFRPSGDNETRENDLMSTDTWIPKPGFKPREKKTITKNAFTSESSNLKYGSLGKLIEHTKRVQASSSLITASLGGVRLPAIRGATRASETRQTFPPTAQYINIYKDDGHLPPLKVSTMSIANRRLHDEHDENTNGCHR
ncbi:uncharacterized protein LOC110441819 [Mizuhopecten yessoensis]|uniref:uncharacterized protein LOC110441819 n=1 Tax=Mizuhopecten yessoensis TaxID=6573 RepID=UPI000B45AEBB|nr:uncharacterized protein LOC110441819 [Mizuhopecten yessoensis]